MKIAVNGLGRIGRNIIRAAIKKNVSIVAINDIMDINLAAYLLKHDTVRGALNVEILDDETLKIENNIVTYTTFSIPDETPFIKVLGR
jgi:glyceraldehyde 3-phosphate dehydrogenase